MTRPTPEIEAFDRKQREMIVHLVLDEGETIENAVGDVKRDTKRDYFLILDHENPGRFTVPMPNDTI
jgi:hypothetical protein